MRTYWIWNPYRRQWHNGVYTIADSILRECAFSTVQMAYTAETKRMIYPEQFQLFRFPPVKEIEWQPKTPEEIMRILDGETSI